MKKAAIVALIILMAIVCFTLVGCLPSDAEDVVDLAKKTWEDAPNKTIKDVIKIRNIEVGLPLKMSVDGMEIEFHDVTLNITDGTFELLREIVGVNSYIELTIKNLKAEFVGNNAEVMILNNVIALNKIDRLTIKMQVMQKYDHVSFKCEIANLDAVLGIIFPQIEPLIELFPLDNSPLDSVSASVFKSLAPMTMYGTISKDGKLDRDAMEYVYSYSDTEAINNEFMRIPKILIDVIKSNDFGSDKTLEQILRVNFNTTDFVKIANEIVTQKPVSVNCKLVKGGGGWYFNEMRTALNMDVKLNRYFFQDIVRLIGWQDFRLSQSTSGKISIEIISSTTLHKEMTKEQSAILKLNQAEIILPQMANR